MEDYKSIFVPEKVTLIENRNGCVYISDSSNAKTLETGRNWATGLWNRDNYVPKEYEYENDGFTLYIKSAACSSWHGGKLSFWTCEITAPDGKKFTTGINAESICELIQYNTLLDGFCTNKVKLGTYKGQHHVFTDNMPSYKEFLKSKKIRDEVTSAQTVKYQSGDEVRTLTEKTIYLGELYQNFDTEYTPNGFHVILFDKPVKVHAFGVYDEERNKWIIESHRFYKKKPKRFKTGVKINIDNVLTDNYLNKHKEDIARRLEEADDRSYYTVPYLLYDYKYTLEKFDLDYFKEKITNRLTIEAKDYVARVRSRNPFKYNLIVKAVK